MIYRWWRSRLHSLRRIRWGIFFVCCWRVRLHRLQHRNQSPCGRPAASASGGRDGGDRIGSAGLETLPRNLLSGNLAPVCQPRPGPIRRDLNAVVFFSCGKAGHIATRCPTLDESFPFILPGSTAEGGGGFATRISSNVDPRTRGGGGVMTARIAAPRKGVTAWTGAPPLSPKAVPQSVPVGVSVVLVKETPGRNEC